MRPSFQYQANPPGAVISTVCQHTSGSAHLEQWQPGGGFTSAAHCLLLVIKALLYERVGHR